MRMAPVPRPRQRWGVAPLLLFDWPDILDAWFLRGAAGLGAAYSASVAIGWLENQIARSTLKPPATRSPGHTTER